MRTDGPILRLKWALDEAAGPAFRVRRQELAGACTPGSHRFDHLNTGWSRGYSNALENSDGYVVYSGRAWCVEVAAALRAIICI
jgi:hypothetical protein